MRGSSGIGLVAAIFWLLALSAVAAPNLLTNGSFEQLDDHGDPVGWHRYGKEHDRVLLTDETVAYEGRRSVKLLPLPATAEESPCWWQDTACTPGQTLRLSAYFRAEDCATGNLGLRLFWRDAQGAWIWQNGRSSNNLTGTVPWRLLQTQGTAPPGAAKAVVEIFGDVGAPDAAGIAWCDDVRLEALTQPTDWGAFKRNEAADDLLPGFCWEYDRAVVAYAYLEDAMRGLRRAGCYATGDTAARAPAPLEAALSDSHDALLSLRDRYRAAYPLVHGKPGNGWPCAYADYRAAYKGNADLAQELRLMTGAAQSLTDQELSRAAECALAQAGHGAGLDARWATPDLSGADPPTKRRVVAADGSVDRIIFGGSHCIPGDRWKDHRLMRYDYEMQIYENLDWAARDKPQFNDETVVRPFAAHNIGVDLIVSYSNHGFMYCPQWLWPDIVSEKDAFISDRAAPKPDAPWTRFPLLNPSHPKVRAMQDEYIRLLGEHYRGSPDLVYYRGPWEANDGGPEWNREGAHDRYSVAEFQAALATKYRTIAALNAAWGTAYASFDDIQPPPNPADKPDQRPSPLGYAFEAFRKDRFMGWWRHCYEAFRRADPTHPVATDPCAAGYDATIAAAVDYSRLADCGDIVSLHWGDTQPWLFSYLHSIGRLTPKPLGILEYVWNGPECWGAPTDDVAAAAGQRNLWNGTALGVRLYNFYGHNDTYVGWPSPDQSCYNNLMDFETDYTLFRPCAGVVPLMHAKLNALHEVWFDTRVAAPEVGIYQPALTVNHPASGQSVAEASTAFERLLCRASIGHATVFERALLKGKDDFSRYGVICLPYAVVLPPAVSDKLVAWVRAGGTLISAGPFAAWNANCRDDGRAMRALLGAKMPRKTDAGKWTLPGSVPFVTVTAGKGRVMLVADPALDRDKQMLSILDDVLRSNGSRMVTTNCPDLAFVVREGKGNVRYLVVWNQSSAHEARGTLGLPAHWQKATDLGIAGGCPVPLKGGGRTVRMPVCLGAGEGTVIRLE